MMEMGYLLVKMIELPTCFAQGFFRVVCCYVRLYL